MINGVLILSCDGVLAGERGGVARYPVMITAAPLTTETAVLDGAYWTADSEGKLALGVR